MALLYVNGYKCGGTEKTVRSVWDRFDVHIAKPPERELYSYVIIYFHSLCIIVSSKHRAIHLKESKWYDIYPEIIVINITRHRSAWKHAEKIALYLHVKVYNLQNDTVLWQMYAAKFVMNSRVATEKNAYGSCRKLLVYQFI
jgi:hypothetical protein